MKITARQYAVALYGITKGKEESRLKEVIENFVKILVNNNDLPKAGKIVERFEIIWNEEHGLSEAEITSARELDNSTVKLLNNYIIELTGAKKVKTEFKIDKNILGGVVIKHGDKILDGSLKTRLDGLKEEMIK